MTPKQATDKLIELMKHTFDFIYTVDILHQDGSHLKLKNANVIEDYKPWLFIVTEHMGYFLTHEEDIKHIKKKKQ